MDLGAVAVFGGVTYTVMLGGTVIGELVPTVAAVNALLAGPVVIRYLMQAPARSDRIDKWVIAALLIFLVSAVGSQFHRQSFDAAMSATIFAAVLFVGRGTLARAAPRKAFVAALIFLSAVLTVWTLIRWTEPILAWMSLTGWRTAPPLDLAVSSTPWGHRHDLALLIVMLYPAWWVGNPSMVRRVAAVAIGAMTAAILMIDGSRALWLSVAMALVATITAHRSPIPRPWTPRHTVIAVALLLGTIGSLLLIGGSLVERILTLDTLGARADMWVAIVDWWAAHPLTGGGPGSFPWILQGTSYFDTASWAPRHPDSAPFQLMAEGGLIGLIAVAVLSYAIAPSLFKAGIRPAMFALATFVVACVGANPTDFAFLVILAAAWVSFALPRPDEVASRERPSSTETRRVRWAQWATIALSASIGLAWASTQVAALQYNSARRLVAEGYLAAAANALLTAEHLDPGMALYVRDRGALESIRGNHGESVQHLRRATELNPNDDLAWRMLAVAARGATDHDVAATALEQATALQRSDPTNLLLAASWAAADRHPEDGASALAEIVQAWPTIVFSPRWSTLIAPGRFDDAAIKAEAYTRWRSGRPQPDRLTSQGIWLSALSATPVSRTAVEQSGYSDLMVDALTSLLQCKPADGLLETAGPEDLRTDLYWRLRMRSASLSGEAEPRTEQILALTSRGLDIQAPGGLNPFGENAVSGTSGDIWGYRRIPIEWPVGASELPSPAGGLGHWLRADECRHP